jgi:hypothetical protein
MGNYAVLATGMMIIVIVLSRRAIKESTITTRLILMAWVLPISLLFVMSAFGYNYYYDRYFSSFAPFFFMTLAVGLSRLRLRNMAIAGTLVVAMLSIGVYNASVYGNNYGHLAGDEFSMKQVYSHIKKSPYQATKYVATDLGVYFDLRAYLVEAGKGEPLMLLDKPTDTLGKYGNTSLIYDRDDLLVKDINLFQQQLPGRSYVWYVTHSTTDPSIKVPTSWVAVDTYQFGYAKSVLYKLP